MKKTILFYFLNSDLMGSQILKKKAIYDNLDKVLIASDNPLFLNRYQKKIRKTRFFKIDQNLNLRLQDVYVFVLCSPISKKDRKHLYATCATLDVYVVDLFCLEEKKNVLTGFYLTRAAVRSLLSLLEGVWSIESGVSFLDWYCKEETRLLLDRKIYSETSFLNLKQYLRELFNVKTKTLFLSKEKQVLFSLRNRKEYAYKLFYYLRFLQFFTLFKKKKLRSAYVFKMKNEKEDKELSFSYSEFLKIFVNLALEEVFHSPPEEYEKRLAEKIHGVVKKRLIE